MTGKRARRVDGGLAVAAVLLLTAAVWLVYEPGLSASYYFDDAPNLTGLERVSDPRSALEFVLSGQSGPSGRPLALASFLIQVGDWPEHPDHLRRTNVLIHLLNALLVLWLTTRIARSVGRRERVAIMTGALAAATWALLPLLASTSMMITQRMTSLSALFVLAGLLAFVAGYQHLARRPRLALVAMTVALAGFTGLATLCKENGALLPVYALATTLLLPAPPAGAARPWRLWKRVFLWIPLTGLAVYLLSRLPWAEATVLMRGFNAWERTMTQAGVLWQYLFNAVLPMNTAQFGPFHDDVAVARSLLEPLTALAIAAWITLTWLAVALRRRMPILSFSILWFLGGHLIESTVLPLDLYFEHRNYLPLVGPTIGLAWLATSVPRRWRRFTGFAMATYIALLAWTTASVTSEWGSPLRFAETQYRHHPDSARAAGFFAAHLLAIERPELALMILDQAIARDSDATRLRLASLPIRCSARSDAAPTVDIESLTTALRRAETDRNLARALHDLLQYAASVGCPALDTKERKRLVEALAANRSVAGVAESRFWLHRARALNAATAGEPERRREYLHKAIEQRFDPFTLELLLRSFQQAGETSAACDLLRRLSDESVGSPLRTRYTQLVVERLAREVGLAGTCPGNSDEPSAGEGARSRRNLITD